VAYSQIC